MRKVLIPKTVGEKVETRLDILEGFGRDLFENLFVSGIFAIMLEIGGEGETEKLRTQMWKSISIYCDIFITESCTRAYGGEAISV